MHCVCKQKQIYFFPFGVRITDVFVLRSFSIGTEVLSFADSKAESSSSQHMNIFKEEASLTPYV
jgi:hypothetical protein